ncbi:flagellar hook-associated protein FlgL [Peribacillus castrilensis]|uniref:Flagellar hook-associated protein FlgL n=1 Tax=Peribacillus frigoritolerans TaxID=450367 RepID=A0AAJ1QTD4_9BACI|nr:MULTISPECIES: flagellar hook-associated protein FlgL [Bacillaceae]MCD1160549.1 flagellar hook-associated protein FlgL [Peribacillus castrilensis]QYF83377.1 flagellar hook-associated protein FlgL [Brevibacterium sp. PAMC21349]MBD8590038.1 flagellar hook-associated protein FlgL [Peribacillus simplex]MCF7625151.1 flagellar hook-associated protein FlgL [Peribacillus frigoritolerans]MCP1155686.1 flagellar hook-associated protein FlgL [Peribacillus frigoritolerans]
MRVTQSMLTNNMLSNLSSSYEKMSKLQEQVSSQKKFSKPSDNPVAAMMGMGYRTNLNQIGQYQSNIAEATNWIDSTDDAITESVSAMQRIRELTVQGSNGTYEGEQLKTITEEIKQLKEHLITLGDTQIGGKYIFNGQDTNVRPSSVKDGNGNTVYGTGDINLEVFSGISLKINTDGSKIFGDALAAGGSIDQTIEALENGGDVTGTLEGLDATINTFLGMQAQVGARQNRIELMTDRLKQQEVFATEILSKNEDVDIEKAIMDLTTQESVHSAALSIGAKIMQPSLLDFLR